MIVPEYLRVGYIQRALQLADVPVTIENIGAIDCIVTHESGWNAAAINLTDGNAKAGHPSQGLMQTIPSTFLAHALPNMRNITAPLDNLVAGIRYSLSRYGSLLEVPGVIAISKGHPYCGY